MTRNRIRASQPVSVSGGSSSGTSGTITGTAAVGTLTEVLSHTGTLGGQPLGTATESLAGSVTASSATTTPSTAARSALPGTAGSLWTNPANAAGAPNGTEAAITASASPTAAARFHDRLRLSGYALPAAVPAGYARDKVEVVVTQRWAVSTGLGATTTLALRLRDPDGTTVRQALATLAGTRAALATDRYDVTAAVAALSQTQIAALLVDADADAELPIITGGTSSWQVDSAQIIITYTRAGAL